jgi:CBS domain-containing protein
LIGVNSSARRVAYFSPDASRERDASRSLRRGVLRAAARRPKKRIMLDIPVRIVMRRHRVLKTRPATAVATVARQMAARNVGAVLVTDGERLVGILTERDVVFRVVARGLDVNATRVRDVMTPAPCTVEPDKPFGYALLLMHQHGFRHLPVVGNGRPIGIVSARSAMDPELEEFVSEAARRDHFGRA